HFPYLGDIGVDGQIAQKLLGYSSGHYPTGRFPGRAPSTPAIIPKAIFLIIHIIGVGRPVGVLYMRIIVGFLIGIVNGKTYGSTRGPPLKKSGIKLYGIRFLALGNYGRLARSTPVQIGLDSVQVQFQACGTTIQYTADGHAMGFTKSSELKKGAKSISCHVRLKN